MAISQRNSEDIGAWLIRLNKVVDSSGQVTNDGIGRSDATEQRAAEARIHQLTFFFIESVVATLARYGVQARQLELELTETLVMKDLVEAVERMRRPKDLGVKLAMDDFGTGYSSLNYLKRLPFDEVKIDRAFVQGIEAHGFDAVIISNVVLLCAMLGMSVIAEGVETDAQYRLLTDLGCRRFQGYLFGRPSLPDVLAAWLSQRSASVPVDAVTGVRNPAFGTPPRTGG